MIVLKYTEMRIYCQRQKCSPRSVVSGNISLMPIFVRFAGEVVSNASAVVENCHETKIITSEYAVPQWLFIDIETDDLE